MEKKDYFSEQLRQVERGRENAYFRKLEQKLLDELRHKSAAELETIIQQHTRMRCPKCGTPLQEVPHRKIKVDECTACGGIWLDRGELETLSGPKEEGWLQRFYETFMPSRAHE